MHLRQRSALAIAAAVALTLTLTACGTTATVVRTVTVTQPTATDDTLARIAAEQTSPAAPPPAAAKRTPTANGFTRCDTNITAKTTTTTCPFAQNVFYAYWRSDKSPSIRAYSSATTVTYRLRCEDTGDLIVCTADDGAVVKFSAASVDRYTDANARAYAQSHDLGPSSTPATQTPPVDPAPAIAPPPPPASANDDFCTTHDCIPNFDNGHGSVVQCEDGSFSQSGGIQGACSHHGGVR